jgi:hypothetical protein
VHPEEAVPYGGVTSGGSWVEGRGRDDEVRRGKVRRERKGRRAVWCDNQVYFVFDILWGSSIGLRDFIVRSDG